MTSTLVVLAALAAVGGDSSENPNESSFRTLFVTRSLTHENLVPYLKTARPETVQVGNYGAMFHGYADNPKSMKTPMMLPVSGERAALEFQRQLNASVHDLGLRVVGHFRLVKVMGDWQEQTGFVDYYNNRWPEELLGPKPHPQLLELLQRDPDGKPIQLSRYDNAQLALCLSSPYARQMLKQMLKCAVDHGVDGVITTYNYRQRCACEYCQSAFRGWLSERFSPAELQRRLGIGSLESHRFDSIPVQIPGYPDPAEAKELAWLAMKWGAEHFKEMYDDIFLKYGRSLRKELLVAQWNHLSHVSIREERMFLPRRNWGRGEDYFWYSGGASFVGKNLNLIEGKAGDAWLSGLYARELSNGRPIVLGKYDGIRLSASMAEGFAMGGPGMGRYMRFENATGFEVLTRYTNFMHRHRDLYDGAQPVADAALVLPRQSVWARHPEALESFRKLGQTLVERQVLLDVVADEAINPGRLARYPAVILPDATLLSATQRRALENHATEGGLVLTRGAIGMLDGADASGASGAIDGAVSVTAETTENCADSIVTELRKNGGSMIEAPWTVRATAYLQPGRTILHLVNYDRDETLDKSLKGPELERPRVVEDIDVSQRLSVKRQVKSVRLFGPDRSRPLSLPFRQRDGHVLFRIPELLVYGVVAID